MPKPLNGTHPTQTPKENRTVRTGFEVVDVIWPGTLPVQNVRKVNIAGFVKTKLHWNALQGV